VAVFFASQAGEAEIEPFDIAAHVRHLRVLAGTPRHPDGIPRLLLGALALKRERLADVLRDALVGTCTIGMKREPFPGGVRAGDPIPWVLSLTVV